MTSKAIALSLTTAALLSLGAMNVSADDCSTDYGGTTTCKPTDLFINKQVQDPVSGQYVENITTPKFNQGDKVVFKFIVNNNSGIVMNDVTVTDQVPENFEITDAQAAFNNTRDWKKVITIADDKKSVKFDIGELAIGQTREMFLFTKLVGPYPSTDQFCRDNWANVTASERRNGDKNFARVCVASKVGEATKLPVAGAEDMLMVIPFVLTGLGGMALIKKRK
jgi:uncharacterized repeat protein (TIGR01451 family)